MPQAIASAVPCEGECATTPLVVTTPGEEGPAGAAGANGTNGVNAFTVVANYTPDPQPVMPPELGSVNIIVGTTAWMGVGQILYVENWGYMTVSVIINSNTVTLINPESAGSSAYLSNAAPGTPLPATSKISPGGIQGPIGSTEGGALLAVNNLSDVPNVLTARNNLLLGTMAIQNEDTVNIIGGVITGIDPLPIASGGTAGATAGAARANLGILIGVNVLGWTPIGQEIVDVIPSAGGEFLYFPDATNAETQPISAFALTLIDDADAAAMRSTLGITTASLDLLVFQHREAVGVDGGAFTSGDWRTVPLNTEVVDVGNHGSIASNDITLAAGTYRFNFGVVGYMVNAFKGRLWSVTDGAVIANVGGVTETYGSTVVATVTGADVGAISLGQGRFTLAVSKVIRLQASCTTSNGTDGFGFSGGGGPEVYSFLELERES